MSLEVESLMDYLQKNIDVKSMDSVIYETEDGALADRDEIVTEPLFEIIERYDAEISTIQDYLSQDKPTTGNPLAVNLEKVNRDSVIIYDLKDMDNIYLISNDIDEIKEKLIGMEPFEITEILDSGEGETLENYSDKIGKVFTLPNKIYDLYDQIAVESYQEGEGVALLLQSSDDPLDFESITRNINFMGGYYSCFDTNNAPQAINQLEKDGVIELGNNLPSGMGQYPLINDIHFEKLVEVDRDKKQYETYVQYIDGEKINEFRPDVFEHMADWYNSNCGANLTVEHYPGTSSAYGDDITINIGDNSIVYMDDVKEMAYTDKYRVDDSKTYQDGDRFDLIKAETFIQKSIEQRDKNELFFKVLINDIKADYEGVEKTNSGVTYFPDSLVDSETSYEYKNYEEVFKANFKPVVIQDLTEDLNREDVEKLYGKERLDFLGKFDQDIKKSIEKLNNDKSEKDIDGGQQYQQYLNSQGLDR